MNQNKVIGILGGMGPEASSTLYRKIIQYSQYQYNATQDHEYPPVLLNSITLQDFDETGIRNPTSVKTQLIKGVKDLEKGGADLIIIACNTVHIFHTEMQNAVKIPIFNILKESLKEVQKYNFKKVGLLSSSSTNKLKIYDDIFHPANINLIKANPPQQKKLDHIIENVMGGKQGLQDIFDIKEINREFIEQGAQGVILGCTELPLAFNQSHTDLKVFDTIEIIVKSAVNYSLQP